MYAANIKAQIFNEDQLGGKLSLEDRKNLLDASKDTLDWLNDAAFSATLEEIEEHKVKLEKLTHSITSKLYQGQSGSSAYEDLGHDEL